MSRKKRHSQRQKQLAKQHRKNKGRNRSRRKTARQSCHKPINPSLSQRPYYGRSRVEAQTARPSEESTVSPVVTSVAERPPIETRPKLEIRRLRVNGKCLSTRAVNALLAAGYTHAEELVGKSDSSLKNIPGIGPVALQHIRCALATVSLA